MTYLPWLGWILAALAAAAAWHFRARLARAEAEKATLVLTSRAAIAEAEDSARRVREESERARPFLAEGVLRDVVEVVDNLDRALAVGEGGLGVAMIHRQSLELLRRHGAERFESVELPFDPTTHEAIATAPAPGAPDRVLTEVAAGYRLNGRLLRAAQVVVSVAEEFDEIEPEQLGSPDSEDEITEVGPQAAAGK